MLYIIHFPYYTSCIPPTITSLFSDTMPLVYQDNENYPQITSMFRMTKRSASCKAENQSKRPALATIHNVQVILRNILLRYSSRKSYMMVLIQIMINYNFHWKYSIVISQFKTTKKSKEWLQKMGFVYIIIFSATKARQSYVHQS